MPKKILVLGYLGYTKNTLDGQTIRTRSVYQLLKSRTAGTASVTYMDTERSRANPFSVFEGLWRVLRSDVVVYVPAWRSLTFVFPVVSLACRMAKKNIVLVAVGGWLSYYLTKRRLFVRWFAKVRVIFAQTNLLAEKLRTEHGLTNVETLPNFRLHAFTPTFARSEHCFRVVFFARVSLMKGIETVFKLAEYLETHQEPDRPVIIDFYGDIEHQSEEAFFREQVARFPFVDYKGKLEPDRVYATLSQYDVLVLPTHYFTEGFPGSILDAYISGIPVVATRWEYAEEFVDDGRSGILVPFKNGETEFVGAVMSLYHDRDLLQGMKRNAHEKSKAYSAERAWDILTQYL
jgi:glycosyltransferase involved in cell wall biosynthesis